MTRQGWIALHRQIQDHWLWAEKPFDKGRAWIDMLLLANHEDKKFVLGNELVEVKCGSFITSEIKLMERWGWGKGKTRAFLDLLQNDSMIIKKADRKKTTITIVNYRDYAVLKTTNGLITDCERTDNGLITDTNNNDNNDNNDNNKKKERKKTASYDAILSQVSNDNLRDLYLEYIKMRKMIKSPMTDRALTMLIKKVNELEPDNIDRQKRLLETAIMNNWKSVYPLKDEKRSEDRPKVAAYNLDLAKRMMFADDEPIMVDDDPELKAEAEALKRELAEKY